MKRRRPLDYQLEGAEYQRWRREHMKEAPADCQCPLHVGTAGMEKRLADKISQQRARMGPPQF